MFGNRPPEFSFWDNTWKDNFNIGSEQEVPVNRPTTPVSPIRGALGGLFGLMNKSRPIPPQYGSFHDDVMEMMPEGFAPPERNFYPTHEMTPYQGYGPQGINPTPNRQGTGNMFGGY